MYFFLQFDLRITNILNDKIVTHVPQKGKERKRGRWLKNGVCINLYNEKYYGPGEGGGCWEKIKEKIKIKSGVKRLK